MLKRFREFLASPVRLPFGAPEAPAPLVVPVLPLTDAVLFPGVTMKISVVHPLTHQMLEEAKGAGGVVAIAQRDPHDDWPSPLTLYGWGTQATILSIQPVGGA